LLQEFYNSQQNQQIATWCKPFLPGVNLQLVEQTLIRL